MAAVESAAASMMAKTTTTSEYMLGPELGAIIVDHYEGGFDENGCYSGQGEAIFRSGNTYSGEFRRGVMDGRGRYTWLSDGTVYEGDLRKNELVGEGRYTWSNGSSYVGGVVGGLRNGHGVFTSADGTLVYEGCWKMSKRQGYGEQRYGVGTKDVSTYAGDWHENCRHGRGTMTYASGNVYEGDWVEDRKEGKGIMNWVERRERYTGDWKQDLQCGYGEHVWIEERPVSSVSMDTQKQMCNVYRGEWLDGMRHGQGTFMYANGSRHTGQWYKNRKHGPAVFISENGRTFEGLFDNDAMVGKLGQDDEHPELTAAVKLKIGDIINSDHEATRAAAVRDVERSALQINSDLKFLYKHYAKPETTAPRDSTMFTMSMEQFVAFATDCRALAPSTPVTVGEVYRIFFRMRRQHAYELNQSLERANMTRDSAGLSGNGGPSSRSSSSKGSNGGGLEGRGSGHRDGQRGDHCSSVAGHEQALSLSPSENEPESAVYDSRRAITFRECVEGIVRLARMVRLHTAPGSSGNTNLPFPRGGTTNVVAAGLSTTPRTPALARIGTAPIEGGGSLSLSGGGGSTVSSTNIALPGAAAGGFGQGEVTQGPTQGRAVQSVNGDFKLFVATHLSDLLAKLATQAAVGGGAGGRATSKGGGKGGVTSKGARGGGGTVAARRGVGLTAGSKREEEEEEANPRESACVEELAGVQDQVNRLYHNYSGPLLVPMTLRSLLTMVIRDADLKERAGLTSDDVKQVFHQANAFLRSRDAPTTPENAGLPRQTAGAATPPGEATGKERKESVLGELRGRSAGSAVGGTGGLSLPTVDSATVFLAGATPPVVDLDLLDQELMPDQFKAVLAGLFELARGKTAAPSSSTITTINAATGLELSSDEPVGSGEPDALDESRGEGREGERNGPGIRAGGESNVDTQPVAAEETVDSSTPGTGQGDGGQGSGPATLSGEGDEEPGSKAGTTPPDWLADPKMFVSRVLQWAEEGSAKGSRLVRAKPPRRVFPL